MIEVWLIAQKTKNNETSTQQASEPVLGHVCPSACSGDFIRIPAMHVHLKERFVNRGA